MQALVATDTAGEPVVMAAYRHRMHHSSCRFNKLSLCRYRSTRFKYLIGRSHGRSSTGVCLVFDLIRTTVMWRRTIISINRRSTAVSILKDCVAFQSVNKIRLPLLKAVQRRTAAKSNAGLTNPFGGECCWGKMTFRPAQDDLIVPLLPVEQEVKSPGEE